MRLRNLHDVDDDVTAYLTMSDHRMMNRDDDGEKIDYLTPADHLKHDVDDDENPSRILRYRYHVALSNEQKYQQCDGGALRLVLELQQLLKTRLKQQFLLMLRS